MTASRPTRRRLVSLVARLAFAVGAIPLLAPTCGSPGEGPKTFAKRSLVIPMDVCYQYQTDGSRSSYTPASCPQAVDPGDVIRAYGLVYELIRNDVAVYWIIDDAKSSVTGVDLTIQYSGGFPVVFYDWTPENAPPAAPPTSQHAIDYRGGPFVVDGSDYDRASAVLQRFRSTFQNVNVHVSNVAFQGYAKRTMAGGWSAGGTVAPKVALLDIGSDTGSGGAKNSEPIIRGYLARAGLDFTGAGGVATATGHGQIYDRLGMEDFQPSVAGDWTTTNLYRYGYRILWVPHWHAPGSCSNVASCGSTQYPDAQVAAALRTIGAFVAAGNDVFAECAGLGSFEGVRTSSGGWNASYQQGLDPDTHFQEETGVLINDAASGVRYVGSFSSPLMSLGDYPFVTPTSNSAILNYKPYTDPYRSSVQQLIEDADATGYDYFTVLPPVVAQASGNHGSVVYLGGHSYSGYSDALDASGNLVANGTWPFQIGGTRLVLNTLFNLGATCTASGVACNTGLPGVCARGTIQCQGSPAVPVCVQTTQPAAQEICNGLDDDCDWEVDEGLQEECYDLGLQHPTLNVGLCRAGVSSCVQRTDGSYAMSACTGQVLPSAEVCNALDDDCDGSADEGLTQSCYEGPSSSIDPATGRPRPVCQAGTQTCTLGSWGTCVGQVLPQPENCFEGSLAVDDDCNGLVNDGCACTDGQQRACYTGRPGTLGGGRACKSGLQTCAGGAWSACTECPAGLAPGAAGYAECQITEKAEVCGNAVDEDCDGLAPPCLECAPGASRTCYPGDAADLTHPNAQCARGNQSCEVDHWGACLGYTLPADVELCDAIDNDCDGQVDEGAICPAHSVCLAGVCVPDSCGVEIPAPEGYVCDPPPSQGGTGDPDGTLAVGACGATLAGCAPGEVCSFGSCVQPCTANQCAAGSACSGGACIAGGCHATGCPSDDPVGFPQCFGLSCVCRGNACVVDPCNGVACPDGTFCRAGDCVQVCAFVACAAGQKCGIDGFCEPDPCAGVSCLPGERCADGRCAANPCASRGCAQGQVCGVDASGQAICLDDPCAGITCPVGACSGGQCFSTAQLASGGPDATPPAPEGSGGCGCGSGGGAALPALLALLAAPLARRRRRGGGGVVLLLAAVAVLGAACKKESDPFDPASCQETCGEQRCVDLASDAAHCAACGAACGSGQQCVDGECGPASAVAPFVSSVQPTSGPPGGTASVRLSGERFVAGAKVRLGTGATARAFPATLVDDRTLAVDLDLSAAAEGTYALRVVNPDRVISNARSFLVEIPTPTVTAIDPPVVVAGGGAAIRVSGTGFLDASQCRIGSSALPEVALPTTVDGPGALRCAVDPGLPPGVYGVRIVNPGNRGSSPPASLTIASGTAALTDVSPSVGPENAAISLTLTGDGFDGTSRVLFDGCRGPSDPAVPGCVPPASPPIVGTTFVSPTELRASLVLPDCAATSGTCAHTVSVENAAGAPTGSLPFLVQADPPAVATFSTDPAPPYQGDGTVLLQFGGTNFPSGSTIQVQPPGGAFGDVPVTAGAVTSTSVTGSISLAGRPEGSYSARVDFGGGARSAEWPFRVLSNQAILRDMFDRSGKQGEVKTLTLQATSLRPPYSDIRVLVRGPGIPAATPLVLDPADPAAATADLVISGFSLAGRETGNYAFTVRNPGGAAESNALTFVVTPGPPTVASVCRLEGSACAATNPTSAAQQSAPVPVRITGANFAKPDANGNGSTVMVAASFMAGWPEPCPAAGSFVPFQPVPGTVDVVSATEIVFQLDTLSALPGYTYYVAVWNGSQKSNGCDPLPGSLPGFTVTP